MFRYIETYNHQSKIGVLLELGVEESVTLQDPLFLALAKDIALHITSGATNGEASGKELFELLVAPYVKNKDVCVLEHLKQCEKQLCDQVRIIRYVRYTVD